MTRAERPPGFPLLPEIITGETADVYFERTRMTLQALGRDPVVGVEIFSGKPGTLCGIGQIHQVLRDADFDGEFWAVVEGSPIEAGVPIAYIKGRYSSFGVYETAILGILASSTGWCTAARQVVAAADPVPVVSFGARHIHPNVAGIMDYAAVVGGCVSCSTPLGASLSGTSASGTMPHALMLVIGDTVDAALAFDRVIPRCVPRIVLVDTFQDEAVESVRVAGALETLQGVRLDTPRERGGVTPALVREVRARLDIAGFERVEIAISGGLDPDRISAFHEAAAPVSSYGVGSYISGAAPIDFTADIKEVNGEPVAKRGRIPGLRPAEGLHRVL